MNAVSKLLALAGLIAAVPAVAGVNSWTVRGPFGGDTSSIAIHPTQPSIMLAQTRGGLYRTGDGGATWSLRAPNTIYANGSIVFDPTQAGRVFLGSEAVYRSTDAGLTFTRLASSPTTNLKDFAIASDGTLYAANYDSRVYRSTDAGVQWTELTVGWVTPHNTGITEIIVDPNNPNRLYVAIERQGIYRSENRGDTWTAPAADAPGGMTRGNGAVMSLAVKPGDSSHLVAGTPGGLFNSLDGGVTWNYQRIFPAFMWVGFDPAAPTNAIAISSTGEILRSADSGETWPQALEAASLKVFVGDGAFVPGTAGRLMIATVDGPQLSTDGGATFSPRFEGIRGGTVSGFAISDDGTLYSLYEYGPAGVYRRSGNDWLPANNSALREAISFAPHPVRIATAATDSSLIYVISSNSELVRSTDGGATWSRAATEFLPQLYPQYVEVDPSNPDIAYASTYYGGLWKTVDRGATWTQRSNGLPSRVESIGIDPANSNVVFVSTYEAPTNIFKSTDGGLHWAPAGTGTGNMSSFAFDPSNSQTIYAASGAGVIKSTNGGASWAVLNFGLPTGNYTRAMAVLIDPVIPTTVFVVSSPDNQSFTRSVDGGTSWEHFPKMLPEREILFLDRAALDPLMPNRLHVGVHGLGIVEYDVALDLDVTLIGFDAPLPILGSRNVRVRARNGSQFASSASVVRVELPGFLTSNVPTGCSLAGATLTCNVGVLRALSTQDFDFMVTAGGTPTTAEVSASIEGHETDPNTANNVTRVNAQSRWRSDLVVTAPESRTLGRTVTTNHNVTLTNQGPDAALHSRLTMVFSAGIGVLGVTTNVGTCATVSSTVTCEFGTMAMGAAANVQVSMIANVIGANSITSTATSDGLDTNSNQAATSNVSIIPIADTAVDLVVAAGTKVTGTPFQYTATVRNIGPDPASIDAFFSVTAATVSAATITAATPGMGTCTVSTTSVGCRLPAMAAGASTTITYTVNVTTPGTVDANIGVLYPDGYDSSLSNNGDQVGVDVRPPPTPPTSSSGGGKKGGGRFDWLAVLLLGSIVISRFVKLREFS